MRFFRRRSPIARRQHKGPHPGYTSPSTLSSQEQAELRRLVAQMIVGLSQGFNVPPSTIATDANYREVVRGLVIRATPYGDDINPWTYGLNPQYNTGKVTAANALVPSLIAQWQQMHG